MPKKILVAEDEAEYRLLLGRVLQEAGYEVAAAANGRKALELFEGGKPDLILLDVVLPDMTGFELYKQLRSKGARATPVLFCTVRSAASSLARAVEGGAVDYVLKPFDPDDLLRRVRAALG